MRVKANAGSHFAFVVVLVVDPQVFEDDEEDEGRKPILTVAVSWPS